MARITFVKKARKEHRCEKCGKTISIGQPYKHVSPRPHRATRGIKRKRCATCPTWKHWELSSSKMAAVWQAVDGFETFMASWTPEDGGVQEELETLAEEVRNVASEYEESASNIVDGFGHETYQSEELQDKAYELEAWADEIESCLSAEPPDILAGHSIEDIPALWATYQEEVQSEVAITSECPC